MKVHILLDILNRTSKDYNYDYCNITVHRTLLPDTERYTSTQGKDVWTALQRPGYSEDTDEVPVGRARAVTCDTIPYSEIQCSAMHHAGSFPVSGSDADPTKNEVYPRDIADTADHSKKNFVLNDANVRSRQYAVKSQVPLEDVLFQPSSHRSSDGLATYGDQRSAGCVYRSGPSTHDTDVERILLYAGEPPHVDSNDEYVAEAQDIPQDPDEVRTLTSDCAILPALISSPLSRRGADRVWHSGLFHDDGLNGARGAAPGRSGTLTGTERSVTLHVHGKLVLSKFIP